MIQEFLFLRVTHIHGQCGQEAALVPAGHSSEEFSEIPGGTTGLPGLALLPARPLGVVVIVLGILLAGVGDQMGTSLKRAVAKIEMLFLVTTFLIT